MNSCTVWLVLISRGFWCFYIHLPRLTIFHGLIKRNAQKWHWLKLKWISVSSYLIHLLAGFSGAMMNTWKQKYQINFGNTNSAPFLYIYNFFLSLVVSFRKHMNRPVLGEQWVRRNCRVLVQFKINLEKCYILSSARQENNFFSLQS